MYTKESLVAFEKKVADAFLDKRIPGPIHLSGGNEEQLIAIFKDVQPQDWVFSTWRSHYHALLKGIPEEWIFNEILAGRSMYLMNKEHRFLSSAIVGGILPIALGVAMGIKRKNAAYGCKCDPKEESRSCGLCWPPGKDSSRVWVFVGDMTARSGIFHEFKQYARGHDLPIRIVEENNGYSTNTPTKKVWGNLEECEECGQLMVDSYQPKHLEYEYERTYPHVGCGVHVAF